MTKPLVYIAGPYSHPDPVENTATAIGWGNQLLFDGYVTPLVPHLTMTWHLLYPHPIETWYRYDLELLARCDALLRLSGASTGADAEVEAAKDMGLPVFRTAAFEPLDELYRWARSYSEADA